MGARGVVFVMLVILVGLEASEVKANKHVGRKSLVRVHSHGRAHGHGHGHGHGVVNNARGTLKPVVNVGDSMKVVNEMCATTTYKDACIKSLSPLSQISSNNPREYFKNGLKLALDEVTKASSLPNTLIPKARTKRASSALESCFDLLEQSIDRLKMASDQVSSDLTTTLKDPQTIFNVRLELGDVNTFATDCLDEFSEAEAPELQKTMQDGIENAKEIAVNMLDIVSTYNF